MFVRDIMQPDVLCVPETMTVRDLWQELEANEITGAPVLDSRDYLVGVVSVTDIARSLVGDRAEQIRPDFYGPVALDALIAYPDQIEQTLLVKDIMNRQIHKLTNQSSVEEALDLMLDEDIHRVIVTHRGHVIGILTSGDLLRAFRDYLADDGDHDEDGDDDDDQELDDELHDYPEDNLEDE